MSSIERCPNCGATYPVVMYGSCGGCVTMKATETIIGDGGTGCIEGVTCGAEGDSGLGVGDGGTQI